MNDVGDLLRATEAAVVSGVPLREVNRAVDDRILPPGFYTTRGGRHYLPGACVMIAFYNASARELTAESRMQVIGQAEQRLRSIDRRERLRDLLREDWHLRQGFLTVDLTPFVEGTAARNDLLHRAEAEVMRSRDVMDGIPVLRGTRVPVYDVAASMAAGHPRVRIQEAYPSLADEQIDLAVLYAEANPLRGRPRASTALSAAASLTERRIARRRTTG